MNNKESKGLLLVLATAVVSGFSVFINKFGVAENDPFVFAGVKNLLVALAFLPLVSFAKKLTGQQWRNLVILGVIGGGLPFLLFFKGLQVTPAAQAAFIHKTMLLGVIPLAVFFLKDKIHAGLTTGALLILLGNYWFFNLSGSFVPGSWYVSAATALWAGEAVLAKRLLRDVPVGLVAFSRMAIGSGVIFIFLGTTHRLDLVRQISGEQWRWLGLTSGLLFVYMATWLSGLKRVRATQAVAALAVGSPLTAWLTLIVSQGTLTRAQVIGTVLLISGVIISQFRSDFKILTRRG